MRVLFAASIAVATALTTVRRRALPAIATATAAPAFARDEQLLRVGQETPATDRDAQPFTTANGVKVQQLRPGDGGAQVGPKSTIAVEATGRLLNLNGVQFFSTKRMTGGDALGGAELVLRLGSGDVVPGLAASRAGDGPVASTRERVAPPDRGNADSPRRLEPEPRIAATPRRRCK